MAATVPQLRALVGVSSDRRDDELEQCLAVAAGLVQEHLRHLEDEPDDAQPPAAVRDEAVLMVAADQTLRRKARNGFYNEVVSGEERTVPVGLDPMAPVLGLLAAWVDPVIGG